MEICSQIRMDTIDSMSTVGETTQTISGATTTGKDYENDGTGDAEIVGELEANVGDQPAKTIVSNLNSPATSHSH